MDAPNVGSDPFLLRRHRVRFTALAAVAIAGLLAAGCGDDSSSSTAPATAAPETTAAQTQTTDTTITPIDTEEDPPEPKPGDDVRDRLKTAGFQVRFAERGSGSPRAIRAFSVPLGGGATVTIYLYASAADAESKLAEFKPLLRDMPDQVSAVAEGDLLLVGTIQEPAKLPESKFEKVVAAAKE